MRLIAIDGPAGSGKSTVAAALAERLGLSRLDTGAMYRAVALLSLRNGVDPHDGELLGELAANMDLEVGDSIIVNSEDVSTAIRTPEVDAVVSLVASQPPVRRELVKRQRQWAVGRDGGVVEGRDIASVVFPDASLKVYLTASEDERVHRARERLSRTAMPDEAMQHGEKTQAIQEAMARRDRLDSSRALSPLVVAEGAVTIDSTGCSVDEVVEKIVELL